MVDWSRLLIRTNRPDMREMLGCWEWLIRLHDEGHVPGDGQCFGFKLPPKLGAPVALSNVEVANLMAYQVWMAEIAKVPPGTKVDVITINGKLP